MLSAKHFFRSLVLVCIWSCIAKGQTPNITVGSSTLYFYTHVRLRYQYATSFCDSIGATLLNIQTEDLQDAVSDHILDTSPQTAGYWVGGQRDGSDSTWVWNDGSAIPISSSSTFNYSQPQAFEDIIPDDDPLCLSVNSRRSNDLNNDTIAGTWRVMSCRAAQYFICQKMIVTAEDEDKELTTEKAAIATTSSYKDSDETAVVVDAKKIANPDIKPVKCGFMVFYIVIASLSVLLLIVSVLCIYLHRKLKQARSTQHVAGAGHQNSPFSSFGDTPTVSYAAYQNASDVKPNWKRGNTYDKAQDIFTDETAYCRPQTNQADANTYMEIPIGGLRFLQPGGERTSEKYLDMRGSTSSQTAHLVRL